MTSATRRDESPELLTPRRPTTFDAEEAPRMVSSVFAHVEVEAGDEPLVTLRDRAAVARYLIGHLADVAIADT